MTEESGVADPRFFARGGPRPLAEIVAAAGGEPVAAELMLDGVAPLQLAGPREVSFLDNRRYADALAATRAGAVIVHPAMASRVPAGCVAIVTREPYLGWAHVATLFHPPPPSRPGRHPTALVDPSAEIDPTAEIGPFVVIGAGRRSGRAAASARARLLAMACGSGRIAASAPMPA